MTNKHFNAILSKNCIARELSNYFKGESLSILYILARLKEIEDYIGEGNQPKVLNIFYHNTNKDKQFTI